MVFLTVLQKHNHFNPRSREGSDRWTHVWGYWFFNFNPRSREGSDLFVEKASLHSTHFNPRSREGSDRTWLEHYVFSNTISIHAPAKGATIGQQFYFKCFTYFNPRSREGSDARNELLRMFYNISIHAPAKGATTVHIHFVQNQNLFQSTLPRRERQICKSISG